MDEPVARYFDKQFQIEAAKILPGQHHAAADDILIVAERLLGDHPCTCLEDPKCLSQDVRWNRRRHVTTILGIERRQDVDQPLAVHRTGERRTNGR